jgi:hypothetical protein
MLCMRDDRRVVTQHASLVDVPPDATCVRTKHRILALRRIGAPQLLARLLLAHDVKRARCLAVM